MPLPAWHEVAISKEHDREHFDCGEPTLNEFLRKHARKNHERGSSKTFVAVPDSSPLTVLGYYRISPASVAYERTPEIARKGLARYDVPVFRLARLAVSLKMQGQQLGGKLLLAAGRRARPKSAAWPCSLMRSTNGPRPGTNPMALCRCSMPRCR